MTLNKLAQMLYDKVDGIGYENMGVNVLLNLGRIIHTVGAERLKEFISMIESVYDIQIDDNINLMGLCSFYLKHRDKNDCYPMSFKWRLIETFAELMAAAHINNLNIDAAINEGVIVGEDIINNPSHYNQAELECIDAITAAVTNKNAIEAVCVGNIIKYLWRYESKNGLEDVKKADWYLNRLILELEKQ